MEKMNRQRALETNLYMLRNGRKSDPQKCKQQISVFKTKKANALTDEAKKILWVLIICLVCLVVKYRFVTRCSIFLFS
ncbi:hypothetical protein HanRHA438_Chr07g0306231 [Helianthus annuus]|nr:hypothetical protein HanRHA438_Chr07g0306231 [Helianthus annuus]